MLLPASAQTRPQGGEAVAVGEGRTIGDNKVDIRVNGPRVVYSKYGGTEVEFNGSIHLILKEDDIIGILETRDVKDLKPLNDHVLIKFFKNQPEKLRESIHIRCYIALRATDVMAVLS